MSRQTREQRRNLAKEHDANNLPKHLQSDHRRRRGQRSVPAGHRTVSYLARAHLEERCSKCDFAFASAVGCSAQSDPFLAGVGSGFNLLFLIARNILSYSCCLQKHIQKTRDRDTPPPAMPTELFHRILYSVYPFLFRPKYTKMKLAIALLLATSAAAFTPSAQTSRSAPTQLHETKVRIAFSYPCLGRFFEREEPAAGNTSLCAAATRGGRC